MKLRNTINLAAAAIALAACTSSDHDTGPARWNNEIRLSSGVTNHTRAYGLDTQLGDGQRISLWVDHHNAAPLYQNNVLTADGNGEFTYTTPMYYISPQPVNIYAIHANPAPAAETFPATMPHTVEADQTTRAGYMTSDLLYSTRQAVAPTPDKVPLTFYHLLSKIQIVLKPGNGAPDLTGATVTLEGTRLKAIFTPAKTADISPQAQRQAMITPDPDNNPVTPISIPTVTTTDFATNNHYAEAIVVPQDIPENTTLIRVTLADGTKFAYKIPYASSTPGVEKPLKLESGKRYIYRLTVDYNKLILDTEIRDWEAVGTPVSGTVFEE